MSKDEVQKLLEVAYERLEVAAEPLRAGHLRDAASRLYYAFFHAGQALVRADGQAPKTHRGLLHLLAERTVPDGAFTEDLLQALRRAMSVRETGDYDVFLEPNEEVLEDLLEHAERFVETVAGLIASK